MIIVGVLLAISIAYLIHGSLEAFPTAEQQDKVRRVMGLLSAGLLVLEGGLFVAWRRLQRGRRVPRSAASVRAV